MVDDQNWMTRGQARRCSNCGAHVTPQFSRVMGDNDGRVHACPRCAGTQTVGDAAGGQAAASDSGSDA